MLARLGGLLALPLRLLSLPCKIRAPRRCSESLQRFENPSWQRRQARGKETARSREKNAETGRSGGEKPRRRKRFSLAGAPGRRSLEQSLPDATMDVASHLIKAGMQSNYNFSDSDEDDVDERPPVLKERSTTYQLQDIEKVRRTLPFVYHSNEEVKIFDFALAQGTNQRAPRPVLEGCPQCPSDPQDAGAGAAHGNRQG